MTIYHLSVSAVTFLVAVRQNDRSNFSEESFFSPEFKKILLIIVGKDMVAFMTIVVYIFKLLEVLTRKQNDGLGSRGDIHFQSPSSVTYTYQLIP